MQQRLHREGIQHPQCPLLVAQVERVFPQLRLRGLELSGKADQRTYVGQRFVGHAFAQAVVFGQMFQLEAGALAVVALPPGDAIGPQRMGEAHDIKQVPARIAAAPFAFVGIVEVAPETEAHEFVIEAQRVVADAAGFRSRHLVEDARDGLGLDHPVAQRLLRGDAGDYRRAGRGQQVIGGLHEEADRLVDHFQIGIGPDRRELRDPRAARITAEGFEIVEKERGGHQVSAGSGASRRSTSASTHAQSMSSSEALPRVASTSNSRCTRPRSKAVA